MTTPRRTPDAPWTRVDRVTIVCLNCHDAVEAKSSNRKYCSAECNRIYRRDEMLAASRRYREKNRKRLDANHARFRERNPGYHRIRQVARLYGLTAEQYLAAIQAQGGLCEICGEPQVPDRHGKRATLVTDHDHKTGRIRGFLCSGCNKALGGFKDNPRTMRAAADYIERTSAQVADGG